MTDPLTERLQQAVDDARNQIWLVFQRQGSSVGGRQAAISRYGDLRALQGAWAHRQRDPLNGVDTRHQPSAMHDDTCPACKLEAEIEAALKKGADDGSA